MTFADELRSSKGPQLAKEEIAGRQYRLNFHVKAVLEELKRLARSQNNAGKYSVSGYLVFFVKHFSLKKASEFPVFSEGFSLL